MFNEIRKDTNATDSIIDSTECNNDYFDKYKIDYPYQERRRKLPSPNTENEIGIEISQRLRATRKKHKISLDKLADKIGCSKPTVYSWEKEWNPQKNEGKKNPLPSIHQLLKLAEIYHCSPDYLLCQCNFPTQPITDVCIETGLLPENIIQLQHMFSSIQEETRVAYNPEILEVEFINYFISNINRFYNVFFQRYGLAMLKETFEADPDHDKLIEGYKAVSLKRTDLQCFSGQELIYHFSQPLEDYYLSAGFDPTEVNTLMEKFRKYSAVIYGGITQNDFALANTFINIVNDFFTNLSDYEKNYIEFINLSKDEISPKTEMSTS